MITALCIIIATLILGIGIYIKIFDKRRIARMAQDFKAKGQQL